MCVCVCVCACVCVCVYVFVCVWVGGGGCFFVVVFLLPVIHCEIDQMSLFTLMARCPGACQPTQLRLLRSAGDGSFIFTINNTQGELSGPTIYCADWNWGMTPSVCLFLVCFFFFFCMPSHGKSSVGGERQSPQSAAVSQPVLKASCGHPTSIFKVKSLLHYSTLSPYFTFVQG